MLKNIKSHWKRAVSGLLAMVLAIGMLPAAAFAAGTDGGSNPYAPTGNFEELVLPRVTPSSCTTIL